MTTRPAVRQNQALDPATTLVVDPPPPLQPLSARPNTGIRLVMLVVELNRGGVVTVQNRACFAVGLGYPVRNWLLSSMEYVFHLGL